MTHFWFSRRSWHTFLTGTFVGPDGCSEHHRGLCSAAAVALNDTDADTVKQIILFFLNENVKKKTVY